jgi:hypothetical protein
MDKDILDMYEAGKQNEAFELYHDRYEGDEATFSAFCKMIDGALIRYLPPNPTKADREAAIAQFLKDNE